MPKWTPFLTRGLAAAAVVGGLALAVPADALAQYFGQNKVRYRDYEFTTLKTEHFDILHYEGSRPAADEAARMAERWYARLSRLLDHELSSRQTIVLYRSHPDFRATTVVADAIGESTGGLTEGLKRRIVMPLGSSLADTDHVLGHELVHAFQYDISAAGSGGALALPLWFVEGMAEYLSIGSESPATAMWLRDAVARDDLPTIAKLDNPLYFPYRWGHAFWAFVAGRYGDAAVRNALRVGIQTRSPERALQQVTGLDAKALSEAWQSAIREQYAANKGRAAVADARRILGGADERARLNVGPVVSPDGKSIAFFSERDVVSIELFLADVATGRVQAKLTETTLDAHADSLQFMTGAGAWRADSRQFVFGAIASGRAELVFYDVPATRVVKRLPIADSDEIFGISWSPDGRTLAVSAMSRGQTDLFLVDLDSGRVRRLTEDLFADLQPAWSPDGRTIAFVTDRFTTGLADLSFGAYRLARLDLQSGQVQAVTGLDAGKHATPQWSADGREIFFVSDRSGASNVYRVAIDTGTTRQVTRALTGVSGITEMSPAFSLAGTTAVFSVFEKGGYAIFALDGPVLGGEPVGPVAGRPFDLPPTQRLTDDARAAISAPRDGLPPAEGFTLEPYKPRLQPEALAPLSAGFGVGDLGAYVGGGTAITFGDVVGQHRLTVGVQTATFNSSIGTNFSGFGSYLNQASRWDWGLRGGQFVEPFRSYAIGADPSLLFEQQITGRLTSREAAAVFARPLSKARRIEFTGGVQSVGSSAEALTRFYDPVTGIFLGETTTTVPGLGSLTFATTSAAFVHDTSLFGGTSPVAGERYRVEAGTVLGSIDFVNLVADYRRYLALPRPFTLAGRLLHYGRYGSGAEDARLGQLTVGYPSLVRGYEPWSFTFAECGIELTRCRPVEQLFGSRLAVGNIELRTSLFGWRGLFRSLAIPPIEIAAFADTGIAWSSREFTNRFDLTRRAVSSVGASLRVNVLGFGVAQFSYVRPNSRPDKSWRWEFGFTPGF